MKVRIAVAINEKGEWAAAGWRNSSDSQASGVALDSLSGDYLEVVHFIEAEVPLPRPNSMVIEGQVVS